MSKQCPVTNAHCRDPLCEDQPCLRERARYHSEDTWEEILRKYDAMPTYMVHDLTPTVRKLVNILDRITEEHHHRKHREKPIFALTTFINKQQFIFMADVQLVVGSPKTGIFTLIDNKTLLPIANVSFSNQAVGTNSNPEFATFALDTTNPNNLIGTPLAAGSGTVVVTTDASYTDPGDNSSQSGSFSITKKFNVIASQDGVTFDVVFA